LKLKVVLNQANRRNNPHKKSRRKTNCKSIDCDEGLPPGKGTDQGITVFFVYDTYLDIFRAGTH